MTKEVTLSLGFLQVPLRKAKAGQDDTLRLAYLCECGTKPKQVYQCPNCEKKMSVGDIPQRGYEWTKGQVIALTNEEIDEAQAKAERFDTAAIQKAVDLKLVATKYVLGEANYLLPAPDANAVTLKMFRALVETLDQSGQALLCYLSLSERGKAHRLAVVADKEQNLLMAYEILDRKPLPYAVTPGEPIQPKEQAQLNMVLQGFVSNDPTIAAVEDPRLKLIEERISAAMKEGLDETQLVMNRAKGQ